MTDPISWQSILGIGAGGLIVLIGYQVIHDVRQLRREQKEGSTMKRLGSMVPFLKLAVGEYALLRINSRDAMTIKGKPADVLNVRVYASGPLDKSAPLMSDADAVGMIRRGSGSSFLLSGFKALVDALYPVNTETGEIGSSDGKLVLIIRGDKKALVGGKTFNEWQIFEINETAVAQS